VSENIDREIAMHALTEHLWGRPGLHHMGRHGHRGPGHHGPPFDPRAFWHGPWRGMGFGPGGRRSRARRGDVRAAMLLLLEEEPRNGYQLMEEIESRSGGAWRPSPGSVYPALAQLEDEQLIRSDESGGRRLFELTDSGRTYVDDNRDSLGSPWDDAGEGVPTDFVDLRTLIGQLGMATLQVVQSGDEGQIAEAKRILTEARKSLYRMLAEAE
jgi:DNA-binding PadR family transcriptional regulator